MNARPGPALVWLSGAAVLCAAAAFFIPPAAWLVPSILAAGAAMWIYDFRWLRRHRGELVATRELPSVVGRGVVFPAILRCRWTGATRVHGTLRDVVPNESTPAWWKADFSLSPHEPATEFRQDCLIATRGRFTFGPACVRVSGPCGAAEGQWELAGTSPVKVFPEGIVAKDDLSQHLAAEIQILDRKSKSRRIHAGTEFESIADYRPGDDPRRIDWRATARRRRLVVRRFQVEQHQDVLILIDSGRLMGADAGRGSKLDCAIDASLLLARVALANGDRCGMGIFDNRVERFLAPRSKLASFSTLVEATYDVQTRWEETDFSPIFAHLHARHHKRSLVVVLSDVVDEETSRRARASLLALAARHAVIFAAIQTPLLPAQTRSPIGNLQDACRHIVAGRLLREREGALLALRRGNVRVVDVEPTAITIPLINQYLDLRSRNVV